MKKLYISFSFLLFFIQLKSATLVENFDVVGFTKGTYDVTPAGNEANDNITLTSGSWRSYEGIRGNTASSDRFNGTQSIRARGNGTGAVRASIEMNFNKLNGAGTVEVFAARYGTDANSFFHFEASTDGGLTWPNVSSTFTVSTTTLTSFTWTPNLSGTVRVKMVKETNNNRCNFDDFSITDYSTGTSSEIQLQQPVGADSVCGMTYNYGLQTIGSNTDISISIKNLGTAALNIASTPITGINASEFSVFTAPASTVPVGDSTTIVIRFSPSIPGSKTAIITINSDDADENACAINLVGNANYSACSELIISEYGDPVTGNGKYIEIYNGTASSINLANYEFWKVNNGGTWPESTLTLSGTIASNSTFVLANNIIDVPTANLFDATFCNWNGNDAVGLAKLVGASFYLIDAVGTDGVDPGTGWNVAGVINATADRTLVRKTSVNSPNTNWTNSAGTTITNSEWYVRPFQINNVGCNINSCLTSSTIGFAVSTATVAESNTTVTVNITMTTAPSSTVNAIISDALLGTALSGTDYSVFASTPLTFTPIEIYPNTKSVTLSILDDAISESNENIVLSIDAQCGALVSNGSYSLTIIDNEIPEGLVINEFSQGSNSKEYIELIVTGTPGTTIDLRGWIVDDNSGIFSGGYGTQMGIADGHLKFSDICTWEKVPVGSIILIYNASDKNTKITMLDDPTDADLDYLYVVGIESAPTTCASMAIANLYFSSDCIKPNNASYDQYTPPVYTNADWGTIEYRNSGDALQVRSPSGGFFHGLSYGNKGGGSDCSTCALNQSNHPDYPVYNTNALYFTGTSLKTFAFLNTNDNDYRKLNNWTSTTAISPNTLETPGTFNNSNNQTWILSLRKPFGVVLDNQSYTCNLRAFESRYYLDGLDSIIYWIKNNTSTDHGSFTAQTILHDDATVGLGFQNSNLTGEPLFMQKTFTATPTVASPANYKIKFYVSTQELQAYCDYINPILNAIPGYYTMHNHTPTEVISHLKIYRTSTTNRAWTVTSDAQVQIVIPTIGSYGAYTTFEYDGFTGFSGYALGDVVTPDIGLPVELINFNVNCNNDVVTLNWSTATEKNFDYFGIEHSNDAIQFTTIGEVKSNENSNKVINYVFKDEYPTSGNNYYRLKIQDIGNDFTYTNIALAKCDEIKKNNLQTYFSSDNNIELFFNSETKKNIAFNVFEISGRLIHQQTQDIQIGFNKFTLILNNPLPKGMYILQKNDGLKISSYKILNR